MTFKTTPELDATIKKACDNAGLDDPVEVIRRALSLYVFVAEQRVTGNEFVMRDVEGDYHLIKVL